MRYMVVEFQQTHWGKVFKEHERPDYSDAWNCSVRNCSVYSDHVMCSFGLSRVTWPLRFELHFKPVLTFPLRLHPRPMTICITKSKPVNVFQIALTHILQVTLTHNPKTAATITPPLPFPMFSPQPRKFGFHLKSVNICLRMEPFVIIFY